MATFLYAETPEGDDCIINADAVTYITARKEGGSTVVFGSGQTCIVAEGCDELFAQWEPVQKAAPLPGRPDQ